LAGIAGYCGVVNRSQADVLSGKTVAEGLEEEKVKTIYVLFTYESWDKSIIFVY
jgi:hypothetical protein